VPELTSDYDLLIATDVFNHVPAFITLAPSTASYLPIGDRYLIANCFAPVIACHLPQLFHPSIGLDQAMCAKGLQPQESVQYGRGYGRSGDIDQQVIRRS
jgi:hypothetical protein